MRAERRNRLSAREFGLRACEAAPSRSTAGSAPATLLPMPRESDRDERRARILAAVDSIPPGRVATYGQIAREAGLPRRARLVGRVLATLPAGTRLPWHRVVNAQGRISLRPGAPLQRRRLASEGVRFTAAGRIDLARFTWTPTDDGRAAR